MDENPANKRRFDRLTLILPMKYQNKQTGKEGHCQMRDVNDKGIGFVCDDSFSKGDQLDVWINMPDGAQIFTKGDVAWVSMTEDQKYKIGLKLGDEELKPLQLVARAMQGMRKFF